MSAVEKTCRTCGKKSEQEDGTDLYPMYNSIEYCNELNMIQEEFEIWNLNICEGDGLPQKICLTCFDSFCQIHNFRMICQEAQVNFGELCTGLDIIIKLDPQHADVDLDCPEDFEGEQTITIQEHYLFPGDEKKQVKNTEETQTCSKLLETFKADESTGAEQDRPEDKDDANVDIPEFKEFQCEFCLDLISFDDPDLLNEHYNRLHSSDLPYPCPKCEKCFNSKVKRNSHARVHYRDVVNCELCSKNIRGGKRMMAQHNEFYHIEKNRECNICGKQFEKITMKRFKYHMSWHDDTKLHKCKFCEKKFIQPNHLVAHERTHAGENPYTCNECAATFRNAGLLSNHMRSHGLNELECPFCEKKFFYKHGLKVHMQIHDPNRKVSRCKICNQVFRSAINLRLHNHKKHGEKASPAILNILKKRGKKKVLIKPYKCNNCPEAFVLHTQLIKHSRLHDEDRPYTCHICNKSFKREAHLKLHMDSLHLNRKPHKCHICGWAFSQRNTLREHFAIKHEDKRDHKCDVCGKAFAIAKILRVHKMRHFETKQFACTICEKKFKQLSVLKMHINSHLKKNEVDIAGGEITDIVI